MEAADIELAQPTGATRRGRYANYLPDPKPSAPPTYHAPDQPKLFTQPSVWDYTDSQVGARLSPERLNFILRQADWGLPLEMLDMFEAVVLTDGHTRGLFEQRLDELCVSWTWRPGDKRPNSLRASQELAAATSSLDLGAVIEFIALAQFFGWSYVETAWVTSKGLQIPVEFACVPHRRFVFDYQTFTPHLTSTDNPWPGDLLACRPGSSWMRAESKRWRRQTQAGILRTAAWWLLFKRMSVRDWLIFAEKFGIPLILGKYGANDSETNRTKLKDAIAALGTEGRAILGGTSTIEVLNSALRSGSGSGEHLHSGIVQLANSEISKIITAGTLTSDTGGPGSFALGQVHADRAHKLSLADALRVGRVFQRDLGLEYIKRNSIPDAAPPFLHIHVQKLSLLTDSQVLENLVNAGLKVSIAEVREKFEYGEPTGPDDELTPLVSKEALNADPADPQEPADSPT